MLDSSVMASSGGAAAPAPTVGQSFQANMADTINRALNSAIDVRVARELAPLRTPQASAPAPAPMAPAQPAWIKALVPMLAVGLVAFIIVKAVRK